MKVFIMTLVLKIARAFFILALFFASTLFAASTSKERPRSELNEEKTFSHSPQVTARSSCGCADEIADSTQLPIQLPGCPCKQAPYVQNTLAEAIKPHDQNEPFAKAFVTIMFSLKEKIEDKKGKIGIDSHNKNMSKTHGMLKKISNNPDKADIDLIHCLVCPLKSHLKYASFEDKEALTSWLVHQQEKVQDAFNLFGGVDALFDLSDDTDSVRMHATWIVEAHRQNLHNTETLIQ